MFVLVRAEVTLSGEHLIRHEKGKNLEHETHTQKIIMGSYSEFKFFSEEEKLQLLNGIGPQKLFTFGVTSLNTSINVCHTFHDKIRPHKPQITRKKTEGNSQESRNHSLSIRNKLF